MGGIIILTALSINFMFSKESIITNITFDNIDALAEKESGVRYMGYGKGKE